ncbi:MAG: DPP IV N-terminal domain-containing protein [Candidatus Hydrothermarchaeaceae archaeon]
MRFAYLSFMIFILILGAGCISGEKTDEPEPQSPRMTRLPAPVTTAPAAPSETLTVVEAVQLINDTVEIIAGEVQFDNTLEDKNPSWCPEGDWIVYESYKAGSWDIWIMDSYGEGMKQLTSDDASESRPSFSPDGKKIAFERHESGSHGIWTMDADGKNMQELVSCDENCMSPSWSPDGNKIVYALLGDLWTVDVATGTTTQITSGEAVNDLYPSWSPDGKRIVYTSTEAGGAEIFVMNVDGSDKKQLTDKAGSMELSPSWSSDGKWIVFESQNGIWVMNDDGSNQHALALKYGETMGSPSWSPDGKSIVINSDKAGSQDIWILKIEIEKG